VNVEERVRLFCEIWERRKSGELPPVDLKVQCAVCWKLIIGDDALSYAKRGLICNGCAEKRVSP